MSTVTFKTMSRSNIEKNDFTEAFINKAEGLYK